MGYDSRLYVVNKSGLKHDEGGREMVWGEVVAMFELCVAPEVAHAFRNAEDTEVYFYGADGAVTRDCYNEPLKEMPLESAVRVMGEIAENSDYRRYNPCLQMLKGFDRGQWGELVVLHYGH